MIAFIQPFGLHSPGGGSRILRGLAEDAPAPVFSIATSLTAPPATSLCSEFFLKSRPSFGRLETTRFKGKLDRLQRIFDSGLESRIGECLREQKATSVHIVSHDSSFWPAYRAARSLGLPVAVSVHDDIRYAEAHKPDLPQIDQRMGELWREAEARFVIGNAMGAEFNQRYGKRDFEVVTDGLTRIVNQPKPRPSASVRVYFMGLFHISYSDNWMALTHGASLLAAQRPDLEVSLRTRCGRLPDNVRGIGMTVEELPFGSEQDVKADMRNVDALYMPLPFDKTSELFVKFSLSTKMVTYLGSGLPILYHGPEYAAAGRLLAEHGAALNVSSLEPEAMAAALLTLPERRTQVVENALTLAREQFQMERIRERFWNSMHAIEGAKAAGMRGKL